MMKVTKGCVLFFSLLLFTNSSFAFQTITGIVLDENREPIPYVNIGVIGGGIGTVSKFDGTFKLSLKLKSENIQDTLLFSSIGYNSVGIRLGELELNKFEVILKEEVYELEVFDVVSETPKSKTLGAKRRSLINVSAYVKDENLGSEFVNQFVNNKKARLDAFSILITKNPFSRAYFRVNVYDQEDDAPGQSILHKNIYVEFDQENGWLDVNLGEHNIFIDGNFFVGVEWIEEIEKNEEVEERRLYIGGKLIGPKRTWVREISQSNWEKVGEVTLTMNATISY